MEQKEKKQRTNEENNWQYGCCDFSFDKNWGMFRMMPYSFDRFGRSFGCRSMMKNMGIKFKKNNT